MRLELDGFEVFYEDRGTGMPVVLVHGLGGSTAVWERVVGPLAKRFRVLAYDLRGLGRSGTPPPPYTIDALAGDLRGLIDGLGLERVALVGHSLGGAVAFAYSAGSPERVAALVGVAAPSVTPPEQRAGLADRAATARREGMRGLAELHVQVGLPEAFKDAHPDETVAYRRMIGGSDPEGYAAHCEVISGLDLRERLGRIHAPTLLMAGELDPIVPPAAVRATGSAISASEYVELRGCGHVIPFERPDELVASLLAFAGT